MFITGCGFHLRGSFNIPQGFQRLCIQPYQPAHPFQRQLIRALSSNNVCVINDDVVNSTDASTASLIIQNLAFSEQTSALGADAQTSRSLMQLTINYQLTNCTGKIIVPCGLVQVSRDFGVNPNAVLGTDNERQRIQEELFQDAVTQFLRQLSAL
jgi:LPS-assembly lipoprotein